MMYKELEVSAHAAAASFYLFLSIIPMIALVLTIVPYFPVTQEQLSKFLSIVSKCWLNCLFILLTPPNCAMAS